MRRLPQDAVNDRMRLRATCQGSFRCLCNITTDRGRQTYFNQTGLPPLASLDEFWSSRFPRFERWISTALPKSSVMQIDSEMVLPSKKWRLFQLRKPAPLRLISVLHLTLIEYTGMIIYRTSWDRSHGSRPIARRRTCGKEQLTAFGIGIGPFGALASSRGIAALLFGTSHSTRSHGAACWLCLLP